MLSQGIAFEHEVRLVLKGLGFDEVELTRTTGDGGIDLIARSHRPLFSGTYLVQCKNWADPVGAPVIRDLYGVVTAERANKGIVITTSRFTPAAIRFAEGKPIELIDGFDYRKMLADAGVSDAVQSGNAPALGNDLPSTADLSLENCINLKRSADWALMLDNTNTYQDAVFRYCALLAQAVKPSTNQLQWETYMEGGVAYGVALWLLGSWAEAATQWLTMYNRYQLDSEPGRMVSNNLANITHYAGLFSEAKRFYRSLAESAGASDDWNLEEIRAHYMQAHQEQHADSLELRWRHHLHSIDSPDIMKVPINSRLSVEQRHAVKRALTPIVGQW